MPAITKENSFIAFELHDLKTQIILNDTEFDITIYGAPFSSDINNNPVDNHVNFIEQLRNAESTIIEFAKNQYKLNLERNLFKGYFKDRFVVYRLRDDDSTSLFKNKNIRNPIEIIHILAMVSCMIGEYWPEQFPTLLPAQDLLKEPLQVLTFINDVSAAMYHDIASSSEREKTLYQVCNRVNTNAHGKLISVLNKQHLELVRQIDEMIETYLKKPRVFYGIAKDRQRAIKDIQYVCSATSGNYDVHVLIGCLIAARNAAVEDHKKHGSLRFFGSRSSFASAIDKIIFKTIVFDEMKDYCLNSYEAFRNDKPAVAGNILEIPPQDELPMPRGVS
jgi:hypothetical protein